MNVSPFIERFTGERCEKLYNANCYLSYGISYIETDMDYAHFIDTTYEYLAIYLYIDHIRDCLDDFWDSDNGGVSHDEHGIVIQRGEKQPTEITHKATIYKREKTMDNWIVAPGSWYARFI